MPPSIPNHRKSNGTGQPATQGVLTLDQIILRACAAAGIDIGELFSTGRHRQIVRAREIAVGCCRELTSAGFITIGEAMGRLHTTAHSAYRRWLALPQVFRRRMLDQVCGVPQDGLSGPAAARARIELAPLVAEIARREARWFVDRDKLLGMKWADDFRAVRKDARERDCYGRYVRKPAAVSFTAERRKARAA